MDWVIGLPIGEPHGNVGFPDDDRAGGFQSLDRDGRFAAVAHPSVPAAVPTCIGGPTIGERLLDGDRHAVQRAKAAQPLVSASSACLKREPSPRSQSCQMMAFSSGLWRSMRRNVMSSSSLAEMSFADGLAGLGS